MVCTMGISFSGEIRHGLIGSLVGTIAMDMVIFLEFYLTGQPLTTSLILYGSLIGGGIREGIVLHLLFGSMLGLLFGISISQFDALRIDSIGKGLRLGVFAGLVTIPLGCIPFAVIVGVLLISMIGFVFIPHLVWGLVLGGLSSYLLITRPA